ncbi:putative translation initiation factor eIF-1A [Ancylostoma caninum]|uniref:Probable RNA-binding protein EIF1AD n=2 Tax=Ancylostoma TaxID=29169 RepID=A0A368GXX8_ANCCA|nr:putative translation initiation factor eIF-1A [Ancylostoma caninum]
MSVSTKRRYITNKVESEYYTPVEGDIIAQVRSARGNNLHEVEDENGEMYVASMPSKFRKAVWIRRGQFVVLRPIEEGDKVKAEIEHVLDEENVLYIRSQNKWPSRFEEQARLMTRDAKRGTTGENVMIDDDMLPPRVKYAVSYACD